MSIRTYFYRTLHITLLMGLPLCLLAAVGWATIQWYFIPQLPLAETLKDIRLQVPLQVYTKDGVFIAEYGEERRFPVEVSKMPKLLIKAVLATEDDRFYEHKGVDIKGLFRAFISFAKTGEKRQGGSTITMQLARNFFLTRNKTVKRKFDEILLALKIEDELSKEEILELYLNKIYFGHRAHGVGAAATIYYGKKLHELTLAQIAMLAGLPKAPSSNNPLTNPKKALERRNYVLERMLMLKYITQDEYELGKKAPLSAKLHKPNIESDALYVAEMVRSFLQEQFGEEAIYNGYRVYTTIDSTLQQKATAALRRRLFSYDQIRGFKKIKAKNHQSIPKEANVEEWADDVLRKYHILGDLVPSVVLSVSAHSINAYNRLSGRFRIRWRDIAWTRRYASRIVKRGDIIMVRPMTKLKSSKEDEQKTIYQESSQAKFKNIRWRLSQVPEIEGALVAMNPKDGAITALVGGFDFYNSKFNRATQAKRQPGSTFKPFIYSAALARGYSPGSSINDAPIVFRVGGGRWRPKNYSHKYYGWTSLRKALAYSHNVSAVRLLNKVGVTYTIDHLAKFGFNPDKIPRNLTIALGTGEVTPLELTAGFAVFANGGFRVEPYFIDHIKDINGKVVFSANPRKICSKCPDDILEYSKEQPYNSLVSHQDCSRIPRYAPQAISANNAYHMTSMLKGVIQFGTARKARVLRRSDLAGKTGTTNNQRDAWFAGYSPNNIVTTVWMGFDRPRSLGYRATGGNTALPMWLDFMSHALRGKSLKSIPKSYGSVAQKPTTSRQVITRNSSRSSTPSRSSRSSRNSRSSSRAPSKSRRAPSKSRRAPSRSRRAPSRSRRAPSRSRRAPSRSSRSSRQSSRKKSRPSRQKSSPKKSRRSTPSRRSSTPKKKVMPDQLF